MRRNLILVAVGLCITSHSFASSIIPMPLPGNRGAKAGADSLRELEFHLALPLTDRDDRDRAAPDFWGAVPQTLSTAALVHGNGSTSLYSELRADYLWGARLALGTLISKADAQDSTGVSNQAASLEEQLRAGGTFVLSAAIPLLYWNPDELGGEARVAGFVAPRFGFVPDFVSELQNTSALIWELGFEIKSLMRSVTDVFEIESFAHWGLVGGNSEFEHQTGFGDPYGYFGFGLGVRVDSNVQFELNWTYLPTQLEERADDLRVSVSFLRDKTEPSKPAAAAGGNGR